MPVEAVGDSHVAGGVRPAPFFDFARRYPMRPPRINKERAFFVSAASVR